MALWWARIETNLSMEMALFGVATCDGGDVVSAMTPPEEHFRRSKQHWTPLRQSTTSCWGSEGAVLMPFKHHFQARFEALQASVTGAIQALSQAQSHAAFSAIFRRDLRRCRRPL